MKPEDPPLIRELSEVTTRVNDLLEGGVDRTEGWSYEQKSKSAARDMMKTAATMFLPPETSLPPHAKYLLEIASAHDERLSVYRAAFEEMIVLGDRLRPRGGYWRALMRAAEQLGLAELEPGLEERFSRALRSLAAEEPP